MAGGSRRFEFGWLEVFGLILVFAGGSVVVFFLGVFVGKGLQESRLAREERVVRLPIDPVAANAPTAPRRAVPPPRRGEAVPQPKPVPTSAFQLAVRPAPSPTVIALRPSPVVTTAAPRPTGPPVVARPTPSPAPVAVIPTASPRAKARSALMGSPRGKWSVQVNATKDAYTARKIVQDLRRRGYNAYAVEVQLRGELWYRVRVGRFPTMQDATSMVVRLKNTERYTRAFLVEE
jgi:cell division septation protein DedD